MSQTSLLGTSVARIEDPALLRGDSTFVANLDFAGEGYREPLVARFVTSIHAHAVVAGIETSEAAAMPGVVGVVTAADLIWDGSLLERLPPSGAGYPEGTERRPLASDRVRYVGEPVAVVVAETAAQAADAAELVVVDYEPLTPVIDPRLAVDSSTKVFDHLESNVVASAALNDEPIDFSACDVVVSETFRNQRIAPCPLETRAAASAWTDDDRLVHYISCQGVHPIQKALTTFYGLEPERVRVITRDVGGSFGAKAGFSAEDMVLPFLAKTFGRPVRWVPDRSADMVGLGHSRAQYQTFTIGGDRDGTITAMEMHVLVEAGAYPAVAAAQAANAGRVMPGPFRVTNSRWTYDVVTTHTTPTVAYRGAGRPEGGAAVDRAVDLFAAEVGLDPLTVRRQNMLRADELPWTNPTGLLYDSGDYHDALELAIAEVGYDELKVEQGRRRAEGASLQLGVGLSTFIDRTAGYPGALYGAVEARSDGSLRVLTGSTPFGQGHHTSWAMLVSERTGVPVDRIEVVHGDTDVVPRTGITGGSKSVQKAGSAVAMAAEQLVVEAKATAAGLLEAAVGDVVLDLSIVDGRFHVAGAPAAASVGWSDVAEAMASDGKPCMCEVDYEPEGPTAPYGAYVAVVEVDVETGAVELRRMVTVDDAGTILNPMLALGQVHGGVVQAIGQALFEEFVYDEDGNPLTASFLDYGIPSAAVLPQLESHLTEHPSPQNPLGFKGIGESGTIGGVPAVQNAVVDALSHLGVRHIDLPLSPERVWTSIAAVTPRTVTEG